MRNLFAVVMVGPLALVACGGSAETAATDPATRVTTVSTTTTLAAPTTTIEPTTTTAAVVYQSEEQRIAVERVEQQIDLFFRSTEQQVTSFFETTNFSTTSSPDGSSKYPPTVFAFGRYSALGDPDPRMVALSLGTFRVRAGNGEELVIMPVGIMDEFAKNKTIIYTIADAPVGPLRQWQTGTSVNLPKGSRESVTVNGSQIETVTYPIGNYRIDNEADTSVGFVNELPSDYFTPEGALSVVAFMYPSLEPTSIESSWGGHGLDLAKMELLGLALRNATTSSIEHDLVPGVYSVTTDPSVPINQINLIADYSEALEQLVLVFFFATIPETFPV